MARAVERERGWRPLRCASHGMTGEAEAAIERGEKKAAGTPLRSGLVLAPSSSSRVRLAAEASEERKDGGLPPPPSPLSPTNSLRRRQPSRTRRCSLSLTCRASARSRWHATTPTLTLSPFPLRSLLLPCSSFATLLSVSARNPGETGFSFQTALPSRRRQQAETEDKMCGRAGS